MGLTRRNRGQNQVDKENTAKYNRESRPWDNQASYSKLPKLSAPIPIRPPAPLSPKTERFVPLLRATNNNIQRSAETNGKTSPAQMSVSPRRKADHVSSSQSFTPIDTEAFMSAKPIVSLGIASRRDQFEGNDRPSPSNMKVFDRMRLFEKVDESARERPASQLLRNSPFKGALEAFVVGAPDENERLGVQEKAPTVEKEEQYSKPVPTSTLKTKIGNREVKPLVTAPQPTPLVGLPVPDVDDKDSAQKPTRMSEKRMSRLSVRISNVSPMGLTTAHAEPSSQRSFSGSDDSDADSNKTQSSKGLFDDLDVDNMVPSEEALSSSMHENETGGTDLVNSSSGPGSSHMTLQDPDIMPRFSYRQSYLLERAQSPAPDDSVRNPINSSYRCSRRLDIGGKSELGFLPAASSFLNFDDDSRLAPFDKPVAVDRTMKGDGGGSSAIDQMSFDEADSFDTFATIPKDLKVAKEVKDSILPDNHEDALRPGSDESEKPLFPMMSFSKKSAKQRQEMDDDDDGALDVPNRFTRKPGAATALRDLQRASVTAGNEISANLRAMSNAEEKVKRVNTRERISKAQGDILLRSRLFRRFNLRYASIVHQGYFGAVLLLFTPDSKGGISPSGTFALKSSKMIALAESSVKKVESSRKTSQGYMIELKTSQRTYTFACSDEESREFWIRNLSGA